MYIAGAVLVVASILKIHQLLTEPIISKGFWESWLFFVMQIPLELGLGIWLLCGLFRKAVWLVAVLAFGFFIGVTLHKALGGAASCGCFGTVHVNPWITFSCIDVPIFLLLIIFRPRGQKLLPPPWPAAEHFWGVFLPTYVMLSTITVVLFFNKVERQEPWKVNVPVSAQIIKNPVKIKPADFNDVNKINAVPVKPEVNDVNSTKPVQVRQEWEMLKFIDIADQLHEGFVVVVLYHYDCPICKTEIPLYDKANKEYAGAGLRFAFIAIPPFAKDQETPVPKDTTCLTGKLDTSQKWFIESPLVALLQDGLVLKVWPEGTAPTVEQLLNSLGGP
jgi:thiol-disulfide isomerase/thioredoxin